MHKLNEAGSMSREELVELAVKEGFFPDTEQAVQGVHPMLVNLLRSELIRELENGTFALSTNPHLADSSRRGLTSFANKWTREKPDSR